MILGTYQSYDFNGNPKKNDNYALLADALGYDPVFCFPCMTIRQALVESRLAAPNHPVKFILFQTDDYAMLDTVAWNRLRPGHTAEDVKKCITDVPAIYGREYLVSEIKEDDLLVEIYLPDAVFGMTGEKYDPDEFRVHGFMAYRDDLDFFREYIDEYLSFGHKGNPDIKDFAYQCSFRAASDAIAVLTRSMMNTTSDKTLRKLFTLSYGIYCDDFCKELFRDDECEQMRLQIMKVLFENWSLPYLLELSGVYDDEIRKSRDLVSTAGVKSETENQIAAAYAVYDDPDGENHSYDYFGNLYKNLLSEYQYGLSSDMAKFMHISRNDKCPCGSGKKFKHCHGKAILVKDMLNNIKKAYEKDGIDVTM